MARSMKPIHPLASGQSFSSGRVTPRRSWRHTARSFVAAATTLACLMPVLHAAAMETTSSVVWNQLGNDLEGEAEADRSGTSIAIAEDGSRIVIGAASNDESGNAAGHVRVFEWDSGLLTWGQVGTDIDGVAGGDESGTSVAISGNGHRIAIGSPYNDGMANGTGHVRVFEFDGNAWSQAGEDIEGSVLADWLGQSVAMSADGNRIAVGVPQTYGGGTRYGFVRILDWDSDTSGWVQAGSDLVGEAEGDRAGFATAMSADGNRVAVGAPANDGAGTNRGHVRVFEWDSGTSDWNQLGSDIDGEAEYDFFGESVSISSDGEHVVIGAPSNDDGGSSAGEASVYLWDSSSSSWLQMGTDISGVTASAEAGSSVSISANGERIAIGSTGDAMAGTGDSVQVFDWDGDLSNWAQAGSTFTGRGNGDIFGSSTSLARNGALVAIGAPSAGWGDNTEGYVQVFESSASLVFDANNGDGGPNTMTAGGSTSVTVPSAAPTRDGYTFTSWNTTADGTGTDYAGGGTYTLPNSGTDTLYAQWQPTSTTTPTTPAETPVVEAPPVTEPAEPVTATPTFTG